MTASMNSLQTITGREHARPLIMVTEDDEDTRLLFSIALRMRGYHVIEVADGEEAVRMAESARPDLILMDGSLPRLDGLGATRRIRQSEHARHLPIVFISGHAEPSFLAQAREAGCDEYLVKPLDLKQLGEVLEKHLRRAHASRRSDSRRGA
jgi:two-component system, cell cycle response regulator DivK